MKRRYFYLIIPVILIFVAVFVREFQVINSEPMTSWDQDPIADCAVVLTGGAGRIREGFSLLTRDLVKKLIVSGVHPDVEIRDLFTAWPFTSGWREQDVILERKSETTYGNAQQSYQLVEALSCRDIVLVTSQLHMARAFRTFQAAFPKGFTINKHALPPSQTESSFFEIATEVLKSLFYSIWAY
jgi:uncharacterized SAM-binding protein YcdF (DUF218 family)